MDVIPDLFSLDFPTDEVEGQHTIAAKSMITRERISLIKAMNKEKAAAIITRLPKAGETLHVVSNGTFDYWDMIPIFCKLIGCQITDCYLSTWTIAVTNCNELFALMDNGTIATAKVITGKYFKRREASVYAHLLSGIQKRNGVLRCLENHSKIALLHGGNHWLCMEGSANLTANPRIEQNQISNNRELFEFHKSWMDEVLAR